MKDQRQGDQMWSDLFVILVVDWRATHFVLQLLEIAEGLSFLHGQQIVHGDLRGVRFLSFVIACHIDLSHAFPSQTFLLTTTGVLV